MNSKLLSLFEGLVHQPILVLGDVMLDTYWQGEVNRISPEAPVPILNVDSISYRLGGAANVAYNLSSMKCPVSLIGVVGKDDKGARLLEQANHSDIDVSGIIIDSKRKTTEKIRVIGKRQQLLRIDSEDKSLMKNSQEDVVIKTVEGYVNTHPNTAVILQDYDKGFLTPSLIRSIIQLCQKRDIVISVDPKRAHFFDYDGVTIFKPNLKEVTEATGKDESLHSQDSFDYMVTELRKQMSIKHLVITLSERGVFLHDGKQSKYLSTEAQQVADVSGAGDTMIAILTLVYAQTKDIEISIHMANKAAGIVCNKIGTASVSRDELYEACQQIKL